MGYYCWGYSSCNHAFFCSIYVVFFRSNRTQVTNSTLSIEDYFNNQQANIVLDTGLVSNSGETAYEILTQEGLLDLIDTMSNYNVLGSTDAFLDNISEGDLEKLAIAWDNTSVISISHDFFNCIIFWLSLKGAAPAFMRGCLRRFPPQFIRPVPTLTFGTVRGFSQGS
ncbi:hypothetical protein CwatDRAFT_1054 [Crocosphaera watsonii WH 8501]|uniref:Uncharacterized protein n=1 Tax=Crocosphaera watsonii WH 8501 TaxID=165597 RepID=Q4BXF5_CROWT|nr:hypothetical protein CwatDRAFT_1054 [Crocosphaera watsonii WH 8501]